MTKTVIALGNPGPQYEHTRHNAGWLYVDRLRPDLQWSTFDSGARVVVDESVMYVKPTTYMNRSGNAVARIWNYYNKDVLVTPDTLLVIHDELDLDPGAVRMQKNRSAAGHNGVSSIIQSLGTKNFSRLRLGIGKPETPDSARYVLDTFPEDEMLDAWVERSRTEFEKWLIT